MDVKITTVPDLQKSILQARALGKTVVFTNGCFDLIHVGHVRYLQDAKALGDILVTALNSDSSVRALKGTGRPLQPESERAEILAAMECVDHVLVFDDPTVDQLLLELRPDIHAKGTDYTKENVPERATIIAYGGRVEIVGDPKEHSTRNLIADILAKSS